MKQVYLQFPYSSELWEFVKTVHPFNRQEDETTLFALLPDSEIALAIYGFGAVVLQVGLQSWKPETG